MAPIVPPAREPSAAFLRRRRGRNIAMLVVLLGLAALFFVMTLVKLGQQH